jgi:hypothetical protein
MLGKRTADAAFEIAGYQAVKQMNSGFSTHRQAPRGVRT